MLEFIHRNRWSIDLRVEEESSPWNQCLPPWTNYKGCQQRKYWEIHVWKLCWSFKRREFTLQCIYWLAFLQRGWLEEKKWTICITLLQLSTGQSTGYGLRPRIRMHQDWIILLRVSWLLLILAVWCTTNTLLDAINATKHERLARYWQSGILLPFANIRAYYEKL